MANIQQRYYFFSSFSLSFVIFSQNRMSSIEYPSLFFQLDGERLGVHKFDWVVANNIFTHRNLGCILDNPLER